MASLLSSYLNTTMCTIAHALEKTKYPDADVHWRAPALRPLTKLPGISAASPWLQSCHGLFLVVHQGGMCP